LTPASEHDAATERAAKAELRWIAEMVAAMVDCEFIRDDGKGK
jgi:hypothetical protein